MGRAANVDCPQYDDDTVWPDLLRVVLCGSSIPAAVRPGFSRSWGILAVDDMYASVTPDSIEVCVLLPDGSRELVDGTVMAEIESGDRLSIRVSMQAPSLTFEVELLAKRRGRVVLPLTVGPIEVVHTLPRPLLGAQWSRNIALLLGCGAAESGVDDVADGAQNRIYATDIPDIPQHARFHHGVTSPQVRPSSECTRLRQALRRSRRRRGTPACSSQRISRSRGTLAPYCARSGMPRKAESRPVGAASSPRRAA